MAVKSTGFLRFSEIAAEFEDSQPHSLSEFIRGGGKVPQADANNSIPASASSMRWSHFYGSVNVIAQNATSGVNVSAASIFGSTWTQDVPKELIIPSGVTIGSSISSSAALTIESTLVGTLTVKNSGSIEGAGGDSGGNGGDAVDVQAAITWINNSGSTVYGGGGGGGTGGNGSSVQNLGSSNVSNPKPASCSKCNASCSQFFGSGAYCAGCSSPSCVNDGDDDIKCASCHRNVTTTGGSGGVGQGYAQSARPGAAGGTNAGSGGSGGSFGSSGSSGANGNASNGSAGGLAGYIFTNASNVTLTNNGTTVGR